MLSMDFDFSQGVFTGGQLNGVKAAIMQDELERQEAHKRRVRRRTYLSSFREDDWGLDDEDDDDEEEDFDD